MNKKHAITTVASKLAKTSVLLQDKDVSEHIPETNPFSRDHLNAMLQQHRMVYVKPDAGAQGHGVMKVERLEDGGYRYQSGERQYTFRTLDGLLRSLGRRIGERPYLIQRGIRVLKHENRPYDFRIMVQVNPSGAWTSTGIAARVAPPHKIVTNGSQGGTIYAPRVLLEPVCGSDETARLLSRMEELGQQTAARLSSVYPTLKELGLDVAVDEEQELWILEVNTLPDPCPFTKLDDPALIQRIVQYGRAYGRRYSLTCNKAQRAPGPKSGTTK